MKDPLTVQGGQLSFNSKSDSFNISNLSNSNVVAYRLTEKGGLICLENSNSREVGNTFTTNIKGSNQLDTYLISTSTDLFTPTLEATRQPMSLNTPAQYLIISHPDFIDALQPLIQARRGQGLTG